MENAPAAFGSSVSRFYDDNTGLFLSLGQGTEGTIHRAVWGPGVSTRVQAMAYVDSLIMERVRELQGSAEVVRLADLGCGVCASLCRMAKQLPIRGVGVTISDAQVQIARGRIAAAGLADVVECRKGDYCALPADLGPVDLAFSIEAFLHAPSAADYFKNCARLVRPGGYLIVCDDFLSAAELRSMRPASDWIERFRKGWVAPNALSEQETKKLAASAGFSHVESLDLTPYLEIRRPRDYAAGVLMRALGWLPINGSYWLMLYGGHALQLCLKRGWVRHLFTVWKREPSSSDSAAPAA